MLIAKCYLEIELLNVSFKLFLINWVLKVDYSKLSDYEINKAVAALWLPCDYEFDETNKIVALVGYVTYLGGHGIPDERLERYGEFNPCNNPSDAWPIIVESQIAAIPPVSNGTNGWKAERFYNENCGTLIDCIDKNPLRAAMIVFLMMQDGKK